MPNNLVIDAKTAIAERARREKARRHLIDYEMYVDPWYQPARHHYLVAKYLEQVYLFIKTEGEQGIGRLMVLEPPRYGKTQQISRHFPGWLLGNLPDIRVILTSYGADLAEEDSRSVRNYVLGEKYQAIFGNMSALDMAVELSADSRSQSTWDLAAPHRGGVVSAGILGGITGKGAHLLGIDDPFKNRDEAESEAYRKRVMSWYRSAAYQRLEKGGAIVVTHTRWHPEDLAGQLMALMGSDDPLMDQWVILFLPALALNEAEYAKDEEAQKALLLRGLYLPTLAQGDPLGRKPGEPLWPAKYNAVQVAKTKANVGEVDFSSLHQQQPRPATGGFFDESQFEIVDVMPKGIKEVCYIDLALGESRRSDFNAAVITGMDDEGNVFYRDMLHVRELTEFLTQLVGMMTMRRNRHVRWGVEKVAFQSLVLRELLKNKKLANVTIEGITPDDDKVSRARPLQSRARMGLVKVKRGPWVKAFINELIGFPTAAKDDQVDTATGGLEMLADAIDATDLLGWPDEEGSEEDQPQTEDQESEQDEDENEEESAEPEMSEVQDELF